MTLLSLQNLNKQYTLNIYPMKKLQLVLIILGAIIIGPSCELKSGFDALAQEKQDIFDKYASGLSDSWPEEDGCILETYKLVGEKDVILGSVQVITNYGRAFIKYEVNEGLLITGTHVFVGDAENDLPIGKMGKPKLMQFPYIWGHAKGSRIVVQQADLEGINRDFDIAAHALIFSADGEMTAWAQSTEAISITKKFSGNHQGWYVNYSASGCYASLL